MLRTMGVKYVIIGHSERRQFCGETDAQVLAKTQAALEYGLTPIVCVGELLAERESGSTEAVLSAQFGDGMALLTGVQFAKIVIAYEPVWAIGTGKVATPEQAAEVHAFIRGRVAAQFGTGQAVATRILYGGSVKPDNVEGLMAMGDIDGALVGGASLEPKSFAALVNF
jgi:triosephosphate isomerase